MKKTISIFMAVIMAITSLAMTIPAMANDTTYEIIDGVFYSHNGTVLESFPESREGSFTVPTSVKTISSKAFYNSKLTEVILPENVFTVKIGAFYQANSLKRVVFYNFNCNIYGLGCSTAIYGYENAGYDENGNPRFYVDEDGDGVEETPLTFKSSTAEIYAKKHGSQFVSIGHDCKQITETVTYPATPTADGHVDYVCRFCHNVAKSYVKYAASNIDVPYSFKHVNKNGAKVSEIKLLDRTGMRVDYNNYTLKCFDSNGKEITSIAQAGTYNLVATLTGDYSGTVTKSIIVWDTNYTPDIASATLSKKSYTYNGQENKPTVTVKDIEGTTLILNEDYTLTYQSDSKNVGTYKVKVKFKGHYADESAKELTYTIKPQSTTITKLTKGKKSIKIKVVKQNNQTTGYQIQYSTSKKFTKKTTKTVSIKNTKILYTAKKLKSNKKYYVRVRTYKTVNGKNIYSSYSKVKSIKAK